MINIIFQKKFELAKRMVRQAAITGYLKSPINYLFQTN